MLMDTKQTTDKTALREAHEKRKQFVRHLVEKEDAWRGQEFGGAVGAFLYRKNRVAGLRELGVQSGGDHWYLSAEFPFEEGNRNPRAAVVVGVCYRVNQNPKRSAPWPPEFTNGVSATVRSERVIFCGGVAQESTRSLL